jgi:hypothetical protein
MTTECFTPAGRRSAPCSLSRTRLNTAPPASAFGSGARGNNPGACITSRRFFALLKSTARHAPPPCGRGTLRAARGRFVAAPCPAAKQSGRRGFAPEQRPPGGPGGAGSGRSCCCVTRSSLSAPPARRLPAAGALDVVGYGLDALAPLCAPFG